MEILKDGCIYESKEKSGLACNRIESHQCLGVLDVVRASHSTRICRVRRGKTTVGAKEDAMI